MSEELEKDQVESSSIPFTSISIDNSSQTCTISLLLNQFEDLARGLQDFETTVEERLKKFEANIEELQVAYQKSHRDVLSRQRPSFEGLKSKISPEQLSALCLPHFRKSPRLSEADAEALAKTLIQQYFQCRFVEFFGLAKEMISDWFGRKQEELVMLVRVWVADEFPDNVKAKKQALKLLQDEWFLSRVARKAAWEVDSMLARRGMIVKALEWYIDFKFKP